MSGLDQVMNDLQAWSKRKFGNVLRELEKARKELETLQLNNADQRDIRRVSDRMNELMYREEMLWLQRSRVSWLKEGDRNTRFFTARLYGGLGRIKSRSLKMSMVFGRMFPLIWSAWLHPTSKICLLRSIHSMLISSCLLYRKKWMGL
jgi:hypothetical protein